MSASQVFESMRPGWVFKTGQQGLGYYADPLAQQHLPLASTVTSDSPVLQPPASEQEAGSGNMQSAPGGLLGSEEGRLESMGGQAEEQAGALVSSQDEPAQDTVSGDSSAQAAPEVEKEQEPRHEQHYWGQALQYLEKSTDVVAGACRTGTPAAIAVACICLSRNQRLLRRRHDHVAEVDPVACSRMVLTSQGELALLGV